MSGLELEEGSSSLQSSGMTMPPSPKRKLQFSMSQAQSTIIACSNTGQTRDSKFNPENCNNPINDEVQHDPSCCTSECCLGCLTPFQTTDPNILSKFRKKNRAIGIETFLLPGIKPFYCCHYV